MQDLGLRRGLDRARRWAKTIKRDVVALWIAARDPRVSRGAKAMAAVVAAYALSPIDLIPDFIPILGYLDDLILVPLGIVLVVRMIPVSLMAQFRAEATRKIDRPASRVAAFVIVAIWLAAAGLLASLVLRRFG